MRTHSLDDLFQDGVVVAAEGCLTIKPFGLVGHQLRVPGFRVYVRF